MNFSADETKLTSRFQTVFVPQFPSIPVDYLGSRAVAVDGYLIRFRIKRAAGKNIAVGGRFTRNYGSVLVQITTPADEGPSKLLQLADAVSATFRNWRATGGKLKCYAPGMMGPEDDGSFVVGTVDIPFQSDYST